MRKTLCIALSGVVTALSVVLMFLGSVVWVFNYVMPIAAGLLLIIVNDSIGKRNAVYVFAASSILSLIILPDKEGALLYALFFGYYPIIKNSLDRISRPLLRILSKLLIFNSGIVLSQLICVYVLSIPFDNFLGKWSAVILLIMANVVLLIYDKMFTMVVIIYDRKYKRMVDKLLK